MRSRDRVNLFYRETAPFSNFHQLRDMIRKRCRLIKRAPSPTFGHNQRKAGFAEIMGKMPRGERAVGNADRPSDGFQEGDGRSECGTE